MRHKFVRLKAGLFLAPALALGLSVLHVNSTAEDSSNVAARLAAADLDHGRKLYETNCDTCHKTAIHWRDKRVVDSWAALLQQVDRWQRNSGQSWQPADIKDVAAYLNARFYQLPCPAHECTETQASLRSGNARIN